ncbi:MAG: hypothetical protein VR70_15700 [Rhodospirillaceae bacterium BRH_c57]|nr:MAG: hypothetical protein VR70_15700 [Rhodospirillaceae bacterium BRH_c57]
MNGRADGALAGIDVAVLAGGLGTRLRPVLGDEIPKVLAPVAGRPFLDVMMEWLANFGARRLVLCLGHGAAEVEAHLARSGSVLPQVETVTEPRPLGTAGALRSAAPQLRSELVMVMNGDSWTDADLGALVAEHRAHDAFMTVLCVSVPDAGRYGRIDVAPSGEITRFTEKEPGGEGGGLINAGVYLLSQAALAMLRESEGPSFERDFMAKLPQRHARAHIAERVRFIDIGTPESFFQAGEVVCLVGGDA